MSNGLLPYVAKEVYDIDQTGLGYLVASFAVGSLLGSLAVSLNGRVIRPARTMIVAGVAWYTMLFAFAHMQDLAAAMLMLMLAGLAQSVCMVTLFVVMLRITSDKFRGRVMGVRMLVIYSLPLGLLAAGALIDLIGFGATGDPLCRPWACCSPWRSRCAGMPSSGMCRRRRTRAEEPTCRRCFPLLLGPR